MVVMSEINKHFLRLKIQTDQLWMEIVDDLDTFYNVIMKNRLPDDNGNVILSKNEYTLIIFAASVAIGEAHDREAKRREVGS